MRPDSWTMPFCLWLWLYPDLLVSNRCYRYFGISSPLLYRYLLHCCPPQSPPRPLRPPRRHSPHLRFPQSPLAPQISRTHTQKPEVSSLLDENQVADDIL